MSSSDVGGAEHDRELETYSEEFAQLVKQNAPSRREAPSDWLSRLPNEVFRYYSRGIATFGRPAETPAERRGRLYLLHTTLVLMWMKWGKSEARERFHSASDDGVRRAAYLTTLEHYRRSGVVARYEVEDWFAQPVEEWSVAVVSAAVRTDEVPDPDLREAVRRQTVVEMSMEALSMLREKRAVPARDDLTLGRA